jgi:hypothetical protein
MQHCSAGTGGCLAQLVNQRATVNTADLHAERIHSTYCMVMQAMLQPLGMVAAGVCPYDSWNVLALKAWDVVA